MTEQRMAEIRARINAITPWNSWEQHGDGGFTFAKPDAEFISHAPDDLRYLLAVVAEQRALLHDLQATLLNFGGATFGDRAMTALTPGQALINRIKDALF